MIALSWSLAGATVVTHWLIGNKWRWVWYVALCVDMGYFIYYTGTKQTPLVVMTLFFTAVHLRNAVKWEG